MSNLIVRICEPLLRLLWPAQGRHRLPAATAAGPALPLPAPPPRPCAAPLVVRRCTGPILRGEDTALARPYLLVHEARVAREEVRLRRARRRALWFAVHGIDIGPRLIHGVRVVA